MRLRALVAGAVVILAVVTGAWWHGRDAQPPPWSEAELALLQSMSLASLPELPPDPTNAVADDPRAAEFGRQLFFEPRLSANGQVSCATCHQPERRFTDGLPKGVAIGMSSRNTPSIVGSAYSPWLYWDGRRDSLWAQALSPLEDVNEHGTNRQQVTMLIAGDKAYRQAYEALFGALPRISDADLESVDTVFANIGKAIAAFERTVMPMPARFDRYVAAAMAADAEQQRLLMSDDEVHGLRLFIGEANCTQCHNGPLLTNNEFHNTGLLNAVGDVPDKGRAGGVSEVLGDPFNCLGSFSDAANKQCPELEFVRTGPELVGALRTPSLRNIADTAPYMHKGQIDSIAGVLQHYNDAPDAMIGHNEAKPLGLRRRQLQQLEAFLETLDAPVQSLTAGGNSSSETISTTSSL